MKVSGSKVGNEEWPTKDVMRLVGKIRGKHAAKKRITVLSLAFGKANQVPMSVILNFPDTCNQRIWYQKWSKDPVIAAAYEACCEAALAYMDRVNFRRGLDGLNRAALEDSNA